MIKLMVSIHVHSLVRVMFVNVHRECFETKSSFVYFIVSRGYTEDIRYIYIYKYFRSF